jgi:hypothetical protein
VIRQLHHNNLVGLNSSNIPFTLLRSTASGGRLMISVHYWHVLLVMAKYRFLNSKTMVHGIPKSLMHTEWVVMRQVGLLPLSPEVSFLRKPILPAIQRNSLQEDVIALSKSGHSSNHHNCDIILTSSQERNTWIEEETLQGHSDWVRDVAYAPSIGMPKTYLASASQVYC